jgi:prophage antirepressor-like protein
MNTQQQSPQQPSNQFFEANQMNNNQLTPFNFEGADVQVITDEKGVLWFVAKDVCDVLGLTNPTMALANLDDDERAKLNLGRQGECNIINESGLYSLITGSRKPEAKKFKKWVNSEVLPSIRKTGSYSTNKRKTQSTSFSQPIAREMRGMLSLAKLCGLKGKQAILHADEATQKVTGQSPIKLLGIELSSPAQERHFNVTTLAEMTGFKSAIALNNELAAKGFQVKVGN